MNREIAYLSVHELWESFRSGNKWAFQYIYQLHIKELIYYGRKITNDKQVIEDAIQDLFIELWQSREKLSDTDSIKFYLFRALRYKINHALKKQPYYTSKSIEESDYSYSIDYPIEASLIEDESEQYQEKMLRNCLRTLSPRQQQAIHLRFYEHFTNDQIAEIMDINYHSACKLIYSGLKSLKEIVRIFSLLLMTGLIN